MSSTFWLVGGVTVAVCAYLFKEVQRARRLLRDMGEQSGSDATAQSPTRGRLRILSQNCWNMQYPGTERKGNRGRQAEKRFDALADHAENGGYDVLILQELFVLRAGPFVYGHDVGYLRQRLVKSGFVYHTNIAYNLPRVVGQSAGVAVFSKVPIARTSVDMTNARDDTYFTFATSSFRQFFNRKGFVHVRLLLSTDDSSMTSSLDVVHIVNVHLDAFDPIIRTEQVRKWVCACICDYYHGQKIVTAEKLMRLICSTIM